MVVIGEDGCRELVQEVGLGYVSFSLCIVGRFSSALMLQII